MNGRRAIIGLSLLCALVVSAFAAPNAMALNHTTAYTCKPESNPKEKTQGFEDEHCTKAATGAKVKWVHEFIPYGTVTELGVTNNETSSKAVSAKLKGKVGGFEGVTFELVAGGFQSCKTKAWISNIEFLERAIGSFCGEFFNVVVNKPAKCEVAKKSVTLNAGNVTTNVGMNGEQEEMMIEFTPPKEEPFATFEFAGAECSVKGKQVEVEGFAEANVMVGSSPPDGATLKFTTERTSVGLSIEGYAAEFEGTFTPRMLPEVNVPENPITLTTIGKA